MPRQILGAFPTGHVYNFPAGAQNSGKVNIAFRDNAGEHDQVTIVVTDANGGQFRQDKLEAGATRARSMGPYNNIASIKNVGPSRVEISLSW
jgi:hypothetical protein